VLKRGVHIFTTAVLLAVAIACLYRVYEFGQERFFTIDEYQFGHATWLVSQGQRPYVDFFEHHFPLSYVLHSVFFIGAPGEATFGALALLFRKIVFVHILAACLLGGVATRASSGDWHAALLSSFLPISFGFCLMSAVDYRADTLAGFGFLSCLFLLELNRKRRRRALALACGALAMLCALMTQKMAAIGGVAIALMCAVDFFRLRFRGLARREGSETQPFIASPLAFALAAASILILLLGVAASLGMLRDAYEITIRQSFQHEALYPEESVAIYLEPFVSATWPSTVPILVFAVLYCFTYSSGFWLSPLLAAISGGALLQAQYPYNYVFVSYLIVFCAVRGYSQLVRKIRFGGNVGAALRPLLYLVPLAVLPNQLGFISHTTHNQHQLANLNKIQVFSSETDAVIDNAGAALFRNHASYYYQHGKFHRQIFEDYFRTDLIEDYRRSKALFWIKDVRLRQLPEEVNQYFESHYLRVDGDLYGLGFRIPAYGGEEREVEIDVVRAGYYHIVPSSLRKGDDEGSRRLSFPGDVSIDGKRIRGRGLQLDEGTHRVAIELGSPRFLLSLLPINAFAPGVREPGQPALHHTMLFEYRPPDAAAGAAATRSRAPRAE
jgi:hypothetical protein